MCSRAPEFLLQRAVSGESRSRLFSSAQVIRHDLHFYIKLAIVMKKSSVAACMLALAAVAHAEQSVVKGELTFNSAGVGQITECGTHRIIELGDGLDAVLSLHEEIRRSLGRGQKSGVRRGRGSAGFRVYWQARARNSSHRGPEVRRLCQWLTSRWNRLATAKRRCSPHSGGVRRCRCFI